MKQRSKLFSGADSKSLRRYSYALGVLRPVILLLTLFLVAIQVKQVDAQAVCVPGGLIQRWGQTATPGGSFVFLYEQPRSEKVALLITEYQNILDGEYAIFAKLFEHDLEKPIVIRVYPSEYDYRCLNALPPELPPELAHAHVGTEIALIASKIPGDWGSAGLNAFRHELAALFLEAVTGGKAPHGLVLGLSFYLENPAEMFSTWRGGETPEDYPAHSWRQLWDEPAANNLQERALPSASIIAYLVDVHGWEKFLSFLQRLPAAGHYRQALEDTYHNDFGFLQEDWQEYYPYYFAGRWQAHVLYAFDLSTYARLIESGEYMCTAGELQSVLRFLAEMGDQEKLREARVLYDQSQLGLHAASLAWQARRSLQAADFAGAADLIVQSQEIYFELGNVRMLETLAPYWSVATYGVSLHAELDTFENAPPSPFDQPSISRLIALGDKFSQLGDAVGRARVQALLSNVEQDRQPVITQYLMIVALVVFLLLAFRIYLAGQVRPPEASLENRGFR